MNRRTFLSLAVAMASGAAGLRHQTAFMQPSNAEADLFVGASGVAFRQYTAPANPHNPAYVDDEAGVTLIVDFYVAVYAMPELARTTFDEWSEWIENSGNGFQEPTRKKFPIGIYDTHDYGLVSPNTNPHGGLDMTGV